MTYHLIGVLRGFCRGGWVIAVTHTADRRLDAPFRNAVGLAKNLRRVPSEKILLAELGEAQRCMETKLESPHLTDAARLVFPRDFSE